MNLQILILQLLAVLTLAKSYTKSKDAVLLSKVRALTLQNGRQTTSRRVSPIPQLTCVGGNGKGLYEVDVMRCKNSGSEYDAEDIQWTCQADLPPEFKLGSTGVVCEGYDSSEDPYILKGSCGVEYRLILTWMGEEKYGSRGWFKDRTNKAGNSADSRWSDYSDGSSALAVLFWIVFIGIIIYFVYAAIFTQQRNGQPRAPRNPCGGGGFWGGGGDDDGPPPPYTPRAPPRSSPRSKPSSSTGSRSPNSGPGFWSGAGMGAAGGYMAGQYMANRSREQERIRQQNTFGAGPSNYGTGGSSWFGSGGGRTGGGSPSAGPSTAPSSSRYESTGFGGTRRR